MLNPKDTNRFFNMLENDVPFSFARFNDGEMMGIDKIGSVVARGDQKVDQELHNKLIKAIKHRQENYWLGKPCSTCFPNYAKLFAKYVDKNYDHTTYAVQFCNNNAWKQNVERMNKILSTKQNRVVLILGDDQTVTPLPFLNDIKFWSTVRSKDGWRDYDHMKNSYRSIDDGDIVILSCGPMSRVFAHEWYVKRPNSTFLDLGSFYDPLTRGVRHNCHTGKLKFCKECNYNE